MSGQEVTLGAAQAGHWAVICTAGIGGSIHGVACIERTTKTQVHASSQAYARKSGKHVGSSLRYIGKIFETEAEARELVETTQARERARVAAIERRQRAQEGVRLAASHRDPKLSVERLELAAEVIRALVGCENRTDGYYPPCDDATAERLLSIVRGVE